MTTSLPAWKALRAHADSLRGTHMRDWFDGPHGAARAERFTAEACGLTLDYAKNRITDETLALLFALAAQARVAERRDSMYAGEPVNVTEHRAALHIALRAYPEDGYRALGVPVGAQVAEVLAQMARFAEAVRSGAWTGFDGRAITDVVNIGIGGSDLGPRMVCRALATAQAGTHNTGPRMHFVANVDGSDLARTLSGLDAAATLVIVCSKTFTTLETMANARTARDWFLHQGVSRAGLARHFVAVSTNREAVAGFGIDPANMFPFWDWVGGRFSLWSAVGLSIAVAIGFDRFRQLLDGARAMDLHFASAPPPRNLPMILGLLDVWYRSFLGAGSRCVAPYCEPLELLPSFLQQLEMESNGKSVRLDGGALAADSAAVVWGTTGTNGQHAYFQMMHQGSQLVPVDFIATLAPVSDLPGHHTKLLANCFAQGEALLRGRSADEVRAEGVRDETLVPHLVFAGNRPSNTLLLQRLDPYHLGALLALCEHRTFVQGALWQINSLDQWGVELGKKLAAPIQQELEGTPAAAAHDASTAALIRRARAARATVPY
ncbi:glucose-6-phosphate isomerase [Cupriavidus neocaledonicus]|uniref:Glucose-6-phosphate isomerase n=1 Tax=Cupriavidus neocaledonicus TaxID=1040979 RepID=A0A375HS39_9BURK|nr:glucose-6-phosphate isomerase [Cupriavidus neocaledonicus]SPD59806.1 Glucose-6-phosphate isomerase 2 [Cupriavidus neocaledonicus]